MKILQFITVVMCALALVPGGAHLFALPNKIGLSEADYFIAQNIYRGWALLGIVSVGALVATAALAFAMRGQGAPFALVLFNLLCLAAALAIFFAFTFPANQATSNWTEVPANWQQLRWQWEVSHAINASLTLAGFCALIVSVLMTRD